MEKKKLPSIVKGVKYACGCYMGSDRLVPLCAIPKLCVTHGKKIVAFWRK